MPVHDLIPAWLANYRRSQFPSDLIAGLVVAVLVIPQSLAYALLAGLPPQAGLYAGIFPVIAYALLGSSMTQALGPVAITAIMTFSLLTPFAEPGSAEYLRLAATLSLLSGVLVLAFGLLRLGFLSQLLSRPVVSGFISGSAILIVFSQLKAFLGLRIPGNDLWPILTGIVHQFGQINPVTFIIGATSLLILLLSRKTLPDALTALGLGTKQAAFIGRLMPLLVVALATASVAVFDLDQRHGVAVVGTLAEGLAGFSFFLPSASELQTLAVPTFILTLVGMVQIITISQALAIKRRERIDANRELIGLGAANIVAAFYGGMPVGGGVSRSAINVSAGARTPASSLISAVALLIVVAAGTAWLARLPLAALAANIMVAALSMIDLKALRQAWAYDRADALALLGTALGVLLLGLEAGISLGIGLSLAILLLRASIPHIAVIGRIPGSEHFRNVERYGTETLPETLFLRIDESLFFGNLNAVETRLSLELERQRDIRHIVLIMSGVNRIDTTAMEALCDLNHDLLARGIRLHLAEVKGPVQDRLLKSPLWNTLSGKVFLSVNEAYEFLATSSSATSPASTKPAEDAKAKG